VRLRLELESAGGNTAGFRIPDEVVEELGGGRRHMGGRFMLGVSMANREAAGVSAGQLLDLDVELDTAERTVDVPDDLGAELDADRAARDAWQEWSFTRRKEAARTLTEAKKPETRARRLEKVLAELRG
jgi:hypothetical protein